jgi:hypothetical protein
MGTADVRMGLLGLAVKKMTELQLRTIPTTQELLVAHSVPMTHPETTDLRT